MWAAMHAASVTALQSSSLCDGAHLVLHYIHHRWALSSDFKSCVWQTSFAARPCRCSINCAAHSYLIAVQWVGGLARKKILTKMHVFRVDVGSVHAASVTALQSSSLCDGAHLVLHYMHHRWALSSDFKSCVCRHLPQLGHSVAQLIVPPTHILLLCDGWVGWHAKEY